MQNLTGLLPLIVFFGLMYFLLIRPQQQQARKRRELLDSLKKGDRIVTIGGIHGTLLEIKDDEIRVNIADGVNITMNRSAVGAIKARDGA